VRNPRYSTAAWQKLRKAVLARDGHICQIQGPRCRGYATSVRERSSSLLISFRAAGNSRDAPQPCQLAQQLRGSRDGPRSPASAEPATALPRP
jgi:hypothetical protein